MSQATIRESQNLLFNLLLIWFGDARHGLTHCEISVVEISNSSVLPEFSTSWLEETRHVQRIKPRSEKSQNLLFNLLLIWFWRR